MGPIDQETFFVPNAGPIMIQEGTNELAKLFFSEPIVIFDQNFTEMASCAQSKTIVQ